MCEYVPHMLKKNMPSLSQNSALMAELTANTHRHTVVKAPQIHDIGFIV